MMQSKARSLAAVGGLMMAGAALAGCGGGSGSGQAVGQVKASGTVPAATTTAPAPTTTAPAPTTTVPAPATTAPTTTAPASTAPAATGSAGTRGAGSTGPAKCTTGNLSVSLTGTQGAAGSTISDLVFTNRGSAPCTMTGYPGVSLVTGSSGAQVGAAATRSAVAPVRTVTLQPGEAATAGLRQAQAGNFPASACHPTSTRGFRVYPPNDTAAVFVASAGRGCANPSLAQPQLFVAPVTTGTAPGSSTPAASQPTSGVTGSSNAGPMLMVRGYDGREPATIAFSVDSTNIVSHLTWSSWTPDGAVGHGLLGLNNCQPNCAEGQVTQVPATVDLGTPVDGHYTTLTETSRGTTHRYTYPSDWASSAS